MRIALAMAGVFEDDMKLETIWRVYEELGQKRGDLSLRDIVKIESEVTQKYKPKGVKLKREMISRKENATPDMN